MAQKPTLMILGSGHLANWGADSINYRMDDVLAPKRQAELQELAEQLARFKPTNTISKSLYCISGVYEM